MADCYFVAYQKEREPQQGQPMAGVGNSITTKNKESFSECVLYGDTGRCSGLIGRGQNHLLYHLDKQTSSLESGHFNA